MLIDKYYRGSDSSESCLVLKLPKKLSHLLNEFNFFSCDINNTPGNIINSKYYDINQLQILQEFTDNSSFSLFHLNTCSLKNIDNNEHCIQSTKIDVDTIAVSESRLIKNKLLPINTNLPICSYEFCPTEANADGSLINIKNHLSYKTRNDLKICKSFGLESAFIEICNLKKSNIIWCIFKRPNKNNNEFKNDYLHVLLDKVSKENKLYFLLVALTLTCYILIPIHAIMCF